MSLKPSTVELADSVSELLLGTAGWLLLGLGVASLLSGIGGLVQTAGTADMVAPTVVFAFGVLATLAGALANPRSRRRLERRHGVSRFGRIRAVDTGILTESENRMECCVSCDSSVTSGMVRRYRQEYAVAGVPVWTTSENVNCYCASCAMAEFPDLTTGRTEADSANAEAITEAE